MAFAMFVFPLAMNAVQYWIIDNFIMDKSRGKGRDGGEGYERVGQDDENPDRETSRLRDDDETLANESVRAKDSGDDDESLAPLKEVNPTPVPDYEEDARNGEGSGKSSPHIR